MLEERELRTAIKLLSFENNEVATCGKSEDIMIEPAIRQIRYFLERLEDLTLDELIQIHTLTGLVEFLCSQPLSRLFPTLSKQYLVLETDLNSPALTQTGQLTDAFLSLFEENLSFRDENQEVFVELIEELRSKYSKNIREDFERYEKNCLKYSRFRDFFNARHTIGTWEGLLEQSKALKVDIPLFNKYFKRIYRSLGKLRRQVTCCPYCGKIADRNHYQDSRFCGDLHRHLQRPYIEHVFDGTKEVFIMHETFIEDTVLPNLSEELFENELKMNPMWKSHEKSPDVDRYDFFITLQNDAKYIVDIKDYRTAKKLINYYTERENKAKEMRRPKSYFSEAYGNAYVVVSDIRVAVSPNNYLQQLKDELGALGIKVATISEFMEIIAKEGSVD